MTTPLQPHIAPLLDRLARSFYEVVPHEYKTYCSLTARIAQRVLQRFGIACECVPCQVWYSQPHHHYVIGFLGPQNPNHNPGKWDGHVVCCTDRWLLDTATHHFQREFGLTAPDVVLTPCLRFQAPHWRTCNCTIQMPCGGTHRPCRPIPKRQKSRLRWWSITRRP